MKVGWLGGSFDPVHNAHLKLAQAALTQLQLDKVYLVLSPQSPFKKSNQQTPVKNRLAMLKLALHSQRKVTVGSFELKKKGISYTVASLSAYKKKYPQHEIFLIMGSDAWAGFDRWKNYERILTLATPVIARRPGTILKPLQKFPVPFVLKGKFPDLSSTQLRNKVSKRNINPAVLTYIWKNHLYEPNASF